MTYMTFVSAGALAGIDVALVALPKCVMLRPLGRLGSPWFALALPGSIAGTVLAITLWPGAATALALLALLAVPALAAFALGYVVHGARPLFALLTPAAVLAGVTSAGAVVSGPLSVALTCLSAIGLAVLLLDVTPLHWLKIGIVAMCVVDVVLLATGMLGPANELLNNALSGTGLPQLQSITVGDVTEGYGDLFIASLLGGIVASEHGPQLGIALITGLLSLLLAALFLFVSIIPSTVPAAVALLLLELAKPAGRLRGIATPLPPAPACWQPDSAHAVLFRQPDGIRGEDSQQAAITG
jgi:hypothetical protein